MKRATTDTVTKESPTKYPYRILSMFLTFLFLAVSVSAQANYKQARPGYEWNFPRDHGAHPNYQSEWWYFTGSLQTDTRRFGYQFTIFRNSLSPVEPAVSLPWVSNQIYVGHLGISDVKNTEHKSQFVIHRDHPQIAYSDTAMPGEVVLRNWSLTVGDSWQLKAGNQTNGISLTLNPTRPPLLHGNNGHSKKGPKPGQASNYYSFTRMQTSGRITVNGEEYSVTGRTWFDQEFGSSELNETQIGWDWVSLRLEDGSDLMVYRIRESDGKITPQSEVSLRTPDGTIETFKQKNWSFTPLESARKWTSPRTSATYPMKWQFKLPKRNIDLTIEAVFDNQEMALKQSGTPSYWEGLVTASGSKGGKTVNGDGFLELTGYADSVAGAF